jgi:hypothetical protein
MLPLDPKRLVKGTARGNDAQVPVEHNEGLVDGVHDRVRQERLTFFMGVDIGHGKASYARVRDSTTKSCDQGVLRN